MSDAAGGCAYTPAFEPKTIALKNEWQRWNDYGIRLFCKAI